MTKLFVGLGNPGPQYEATRHNAGFWWIDALASTWKVQLTHEPGYHAMQVRGNQAGEAVWLQKPLTFMNLSGKSVGSLARFYKIAPQDILVIHDELDLPPGEAKLKLGGSHAGHNGLKDIAAALGTLDFWRLRIGIGHPGVKAEVHNWVLGKPKSDDRTAIDDSITRSLGGIAAWMAGDMPKATQHIHTAKPPRPKPPRALPVMDAQTAAI